MPRTCTRTVPIQVTRIRQRVESEDMLLLLLTSSTVAQSPWGPPGQSGGKVTIQYLLEITCTVCSVQSLRLKKGFASLVYVTN